MKRVVQIGAFILGFNLIVIIGMMSYSAGFNWAAESIPPLYRYGDLYFFSKLPGFRINTSNQVKLKQVKPLHMVRLTVIGDSYLDGLSNHNFRCQKLDHLDWGYLPDTIQQIDTNNVNILIIETTERYARWRLRMRYLTAFGKKYTPPIQDEIKLNAEDNLQFQLTNFDFLLVFKEIKAQLYLNLFNRFDNRIAQPNGSNRLYLNETIDKHLNSSSYAKIDNKEINEMVNGINLIVGDALYQGFDAVYFSIIPNTASIYNYNGMKYNHLIERVQNHPNLKMPFIDAFSLLLKSKNIVFHRSDSHWNSLGQQLWLDEVNKTIVNKAR